MRWRMRIGHYEPTTVVTLDEGRISPTFDSEELRRYHDFPGMTDEDLFCLVFHEFSRSVKVAYLDEGPLTPREVYDRGAAVYARAWEEWQRRSRERGKRRRAMMNYVAACETLYRVWSEGTLEENGWSGELRRQLERRKVSFDHAPEPYLLFDGADPTDVDAPQLVFITTNPGREMPFQAHEQAAGRSSYTTLQHELTEGPYRKETSKIGPAQRRIERMREIAEYLEPTTGATGFVQCEVVPFHSGTLPNKRGLAKWLREEGADNALLGYLSSLRAFLEGKHVIAIDAAHLTNREQGDRSTPRSDSDVWSSEWLRWKASLFGFDYLRFYDDGSHKPTFLGRNGGPGTRFYGYRAPDRLLRGYYLAQGGNNLGNHVKSICRTFGTDHSNL